MVEHFQRFSAAQFQRCHLLPVPPSPSPPHLQSYIKIGQEQGASMLCGGRRCGEKGYYIEPTIFADVTGEQPWLGWGLGGGWAGWRGCVTTAPAF